MAMPDLNSMSLDELKKLQKDAEKAIATFKDRQKAEARARLDAVAREMGYSLADLADAPKARLRTAAPQKYGDPKEPSQTWSGRGRRPRWVTEALAAGKSLEDLRIGN